ncbi:MAG: thioredoxin domain-containing protein [Acidobacteriota bacterium]
MTQKNKHTNPLINETSPYLLQHANNPVHWNSWNEQALSRARKENKPIFLSIGYSSCHWCHVMERESFKNEKIADILNKNFISIKVDREERPDIDEIYMSAVVALSSRGGWPLTVFLTPELKPFFGGTYFPPEDKQGLVGFKRLITRVTEIWNEEKERKKIILDAERLTHALEKRTSVNASEQSTELLDRDLLNNAVQELEKSFDPEWGGFGRAPKFPPCGAISFLLHDYYHTKNKNSLEMVITTLDRMQSGGLHDHLAGGFHRYSTDRQWLVPHFEKMLYDNAQLASVYFQAYLVTGNQNYSITAQKILDYIAVYMTHESGGFYSAEDADVQEKEGLFYLWKRDEINKALDREEAEIFCAFYHVNPEGNFPYQESYHKNMNILHMRESLSSLSQKFNTDENKLRDILDTAKSKLLKTRDKRVRPFLDDKIITSWNSLMISAFSQGYQVLGDNSYLRHAQEAAQFIIHNLQNKEGFLFHTYRSGKKKHFAFLEDYAFFIRSLIDLYESDFNEEWILHAEKFTNDMISLFWDPKKGHFTNTSPYHQNQIVRTITPNDSAVPSPSGVSVEILIKLGHLFQKKDYLERSKKILQSINKQMSKYPQSYMKMLLNVSCLIDPIKEVAVVGKKNSAQTQKFLRAIRKRFMAHHILALHDPENKESQKLSTRIPLLRNKKLINEKPAVYICENYSCKNPVTSSEKLEEQL